MSFKQKSVERFWKKVKKTSSCWIWIAYTDKDGYGNITIDNYPRKAHRVSYEIENGSIPLGMCVLHSCDTPACVNPKHLWIGTFHENNKDRQLKGRSSDRRGDKCPTAKLSWVDVRKIRTSDGKTQQELADKYAVSQTLIGKILRNQVWIV